MKKYPYGRPRTIIRITPALFLTGSRQIVFVIIGLFTLDFFFKSNFVKFQKILFLLFISGIVYFFYPVINNYFTALIKVTQEQNVTSNEYIRALEINFFLFNYFPHWSCYIFGNGWEHSLSSYGQEMINQIYFRSDIGLFGAFNKFGIIYVIIVLIILFKVIISKKTIKVPGHIRLLFIFLLITSFTGVNYFETTENIILFTFLLYIIEKRSEDSLYFNSNP